MYEIVHNLYLSSWIDVQTADIDDSWHVINCTKDIVMINNNHTRLPVDDDGSQQCMDEMKHHIYNVLDIIDAQLAQGTKVAVHCQAGQQRSATVVAAYLIRKRGFFLDAAMSLVKSRKPDAFFWQANFLPVLQAMSRI